MYCEDINLTVDRAVITVSQHLDSRTTNYAAECC